MDADKGLEKMWNGLGGSVRELVEGKVLWKFEGWEQGV